MDDKILKEDKYPKIESMRRLTLFSKLAAALSHSKGKREGIFSWVTRSVNPLKHQGPAPA